MDKHVDEPNKSKIKCIYLQTKQSQYQIYSKNCKIITLTLDRNMEKQINLSIKI